MIRANLPVYIAWRTSERTDAVLQKFPFLREFLPPMEGVLSVPDPNDGALQFRWSDFERAGSMRDAWTTIEADDGQRHRGGSDKRPHGPGQRAGESFKEFFE